jgi:hypothetical protein
MARPAWAHAEAQREWVWTIAPTPANLWYKTRCVGVSDDGRIDSSTTAPSLNLTTTMCSAVACAHEIPLTLIAITSRARATALALTKDNFDQAVLGEGAIGGNDPLTEFGQRHSRLRRSATLAPPARRLAVHGGAYPLDVSIRMPTLVCSPTTRFAGRSDPPSPIGTV